jgi:hypothetical protein
LDYREQVLETYLNSLTAMGASEKIIRAALMAFDTGFSCGILNGQDGETQMAMIDALSYQKQIH